MQITNRKLGIGIPLTWPQVPSPFFDSFTIMEKPPFHYLRANNGPIDELRNNLVEQAQNLGCSHLIMMDADMVYPRMVLAPLLRHKRPVAGGLCFRRYPPFDPLIYRGGINRYKTIEEWTEGELLEVDATGTGCLLFDMEVFDRVKPPWFRFEPNPNQEVGGLIGEDIGFCSRLKAAGYQIFVDTSIEIGHLSTFEVTRETWQLYKQLKEVQKRRRKNDDCA